MYGKFRAPKRNGCGYRKPKIAEFLTTVAEIRKVSGNIVDLTRLVANGNDGRNDVVKVMNWLIAAGHEYPEFETALELAIPADYAAALAPKKKGAKKQILTTAERASYAALLGVQLKV